MAAKKMYGVRLNEEDAALFEEVCARNEIGLQRALEEATREYVQRELRYIRGKEEARAALVEYINTGETFDEDEVERRIAEKLNSKGIEL